jgi:uncharacterized protein (TIGR02597 family)
MKMIRFKLSSAAFLATLAAMNVAGFVTPVAFWATLVVINMVGFHATAELVSEPAGYYKLTFLGNSDTIVSIPFARPAKASGVVNSVSGNVVQVQGVPNWTSNQFVYAAGVQSNTYYLRFASGAKEGYYYPITGNDTNALTLNLGSDTLSAVTQNDRLSVVPYWTLGTIFPDGRGVFPSPSSLNRPTEVLLPSLNGTGINLSASKIYYFNAGIWKQIGQGSANKNDDAFPPNTYMIVRHNVATNTTLKAMGAVIVPKIGLPLRTSAATKQDNYVGLARPVPVSLNASGLDSGGAFSVSSSTLNRTDELLVFDNTTTNKNRSASAVYYYLSSGWRRVGTNSTFVGTNEVFTPGTGVIIRKTTNNITPVWINPASY